MYINNYKLNMDGKIEVDTQVNSVHNSPNIKPKRVKKQYILDHYYNANLIEAGIDEAGRGPMLGRVYAGACILPKDASFNHLLLKDSKKYSSKRLLLNAYNYIKENAISHSFGFIEADEIDNINIRQATFKAMHIAINNLSVKPQHLIVDGNSFKPYTKITELGFNIIPHTCIEGGDNIYTPIAAASIIAKVERDKYIEELCDQYPYLEQWDIRNSKGYGTKKHLQGIQEHGITPWHRRSFGVCKKYTQVN